MPGLQDHPGGDDTRSSKPSSEDSSVTMALALNPTPEQAKETAKHWAKVYRTGIASGVSSVLSTVAAFPLDSVKTRMQAYRYKHFTECVQHTYKTEGVKGFWRGALAPVFSVTLVRMTSFSIYQKAKYKYSAAIGRATGGDEPLVVVNTPGSTPTFATMACFGAAGVTAGSIVTFISCPFELTKMSAQISTLMAKSNTSSMDDPVRLTYQQKGTFKTAKNIVAHRGFAGLYSGFGLHLLRDSIGTTIYFTTYESTKQLLVKFQGSDSPTSPLSVAMAGGFCGLASWVCIYPIDTAKTHYQRNCLTKAKGQPVQIPKIEFFKRQMYRGLGVSMARSCTINTIFFSSFEFIKKQINQLPDPVLESVD
ncbi:hypothetical protein MMC28_009246 [Mycoblastus sanguinarius]|nr:hypothetical protein [Mycoblastus sanguinarius]